MYTNNIIEFPKITLYVVFQYIHRITLIYIIIVYIIRIFIAQKTPTVAGLDGIMNSHLWITNGLKLTDIFG